MYVDDTLTPKEAVRLCALGTLAGGPMRYSALAEQTRHFISRVLGPSLDVMGTSVELLKYEGLVEPIDGIGLEDDAELAITEAGREEFRNLLTANLRASAADLNKLIVALKFRFLHLLDEGDQSAQADLLAEVSGIELTRLIDLREHHAESGGYLVDWLDYEIAELEARLAWLEEFSSQLKGET